MQQRKTGIRRSRGEWSRLVAVWKRSGLPAREFAAKHGLRPEQLSWWRWYLKSNKTKQGAGAPDGLRLLPVTIENESTPRVGRRPGVALELTTASGHVLRVDHMSPGDVNLLLKELLTGKE